jgi:hypothetical protein
MSMKVIAVACMSALCGCAALVRETRAPPLEKLEAPGSGRNLQRADRHWPQGLPLPGPAHTLETGYSGTLQVHDAEEERRREMAD